MHKKYRHQKVKKCLAFILSEYWVFFGEKALIIQPEWVFFIFSF